MKTSRNSLYGTTAMTPMERKAGRYLRAPDHPSGGNVSGDSAQELDNPAGNPGDSPQSQPGENNSGQEFDAASFWAKSADDNSDDDDNGSDESDPGVELGKQIADSIAKATIPQVFSKDVAEQIAEGNLEGVNAAMEAYGRHAIQQAVVNSAKIVQHYGEQILNQMRQEMDSRLGSEKSTDMLRQEFPSMADPAMAPVIQGVFDQAMRHSKNDRSKAIEMTRGMLRAMGKIGGKDMGLTSPAPSPDDFTGGNPSSLVAELLGRDS